MAVIVDDVQRLDRLITDISDASRLDAELSRAEMGPVSIRPMLEMLAEIHESEAEERGVKITVSADAADPLDILGLESRLVQVIRNLIGNAVSFSPEGGTIAMRAWRTKTKVIITVEDDGPGIPPGKEEDIFKRFYSERPREEKFGTHSGLGLSISKQIVETHGGSIRAENRKDGEGKIAGARFTVELPAG
jgi:two-component system sensor histidine kinase ChvG